MSGLPDPSCSPRPLREAQETADRITDKMPPTEYRWIFALPAGDGFTIVDLWWDTCPRMSPDAILLARLEQ